MSEKMTYSDSLMTDPDLKTPLHDEIVTWCFNNTETILAKFSADGLSPSIINKTIEAPIYRFKNNSYSLNDAFIVGFADLLIRIEDKHGYDKEIYFEIKSKITSLGDLVRQLQFYKSAIQTRKPGPIFIVVSPDADNYHDILISQGILTFKYPDNNQSVS